MACLRAAGEAAGGEQAQVVPEIGRGRGFERGRTFLQRPLQPTEVARVGILRMG